MLTAWYQIVLNYVAIVCPRLTFYSYLSGGNCRWRDRWRREVIVWQEQKKRESFGLSCLPPRQVTPKDSQSALTSQYTTRYTKTLPETPKDIPKQHQKLHIGITIYLQTFKMVFCLCRYMRSQGKMKPSYHFSTTLNCKIFSTWSFWEIKITKLPHKSFLKINGLGHFM